MRNDIRLFLVAVVVLVVALGYKNAHAELWGLRTPGDWQQMWEQPALKPTPKPTRKTTTKSVTPAHLTTMWERWMQGVMKNEERRQKIRNR